MLVSGLGDGGDRSSTFGNRQQQCKSLGVEFACLCHMAVVGQTGWLWHHLRREPLRRCRMQLWIGAVCSKPGCCDLLMLCRSLDGTNRHAFAGI
jgi:hypothetical protein